MTINMEKVFYYDKLIANVENLRLKINKAIKNNKDLEQNFQLRNTADYILKGLNKRRDQAMKGHI